MAFIGKLKKELCQPIKISWIKGHQDDNNAYDKLTRHTKQNIDVDHLATAPCLHDEVVRCATSKPVCILSCSRLGCPIFSRCTRHSRFVLLSWKLVFGLAEGDSLGGNFSSNSPDVGWSRGGLGEIKRLVSYDLVAGDGTVDSR